MVCGKWRLGREIGRGAYGAVYIATDPDGDTVAVKVCRRDRMDLDRYQRELRGAKLYRSIQAVVGLVRMLGFDECNWGFYAAMELADDEFGVCPSGISDYHPKTLASIIAGETALSVEDSVELGISLAKGLIVLHRHHLLHRDVKPGNVLYVHGCPVLADWGLVVDEAEAVSHVGTPGYVPPENFTGADGDIFSLGLTLKAASFGRPVEDLDMGPAMEADTDNRLFAAWWRILNRATNLDHARRYRSAKALLKDLMSLRRRMAVSTLIRPREMPIFVWFAIFAALTTWALSLVFRMIMEYMEICNGLSKLS